MKISELIEKLQEIQEIKGDIDVCYDDDTYEICSIGEVNIEELRNEPEPSFFLVILK